MTHALLFSQNETRIPVTQYMKQCEKTRALENFPFFPELSRRGDLRKREFGILVVAEDLGVGQRGLFHEDQLLSEGTEES